MQYKLKELRDNKKKVMRAYAKSHNIIILAFVEEFKELVGVSVREHRNYMNEIYYTFGRLFYMGSEQCCYEQCGCASFRDPKEVRNHAYKFFSIK